MLETSQLPPADPGTLESLWNMLQNGGPVIYPLGLLSVISVAFMVERSMRLRSTYVGGVRHGNKVLDALEAEGAEGAIAACEARENSMSRVLLAGLRRLSNPYAEREKAVEDAALREVRSLSSNLRPLMVVSVLSPLLGLLGTVWGMILAFSQIATADGIGKPEVLAQGISQALITTAVGLAVAIPSQAAYYWFRSRVDKFVRTTELVYADISDFIATGQRPQHGGKTDSEDAAAEANEQA